MRTSGPEHPTTAWPFGRQSTRTARGRVSVAAASALLL